MKRNAGLIALVVLTAVNLLNYIDRFIFSALAPAIQKDLNFTDTELGLLGSGFIFAYIFAAPLFGWLGDRAARSRLMAGGVALWSFATAFSGFSLTFSTQMLTRVVVGFGESVYSVISPSVLADYFGKKNRGRVFALYSGAIPVGSALGFILGGQLEKYFGWHKAFFFVGFPGLLCALILFFMRDPIRGATEPEASQAPSLKETVPLLVRNGGFIFTVLGYAAYTFVVGGLAFWMPSYIVRYFDVSLATGSTVFGGLTVVGGFIGTLLGGWLSDRIESRTGNGYMKVSMVAMLVAAPLLIFALRIQDFKMFCVVLFVMEVALFLCISPLDVAVVNCIRPSLRSSAMALNVFLIHALGDGISRILIGSLSDAEGLRAGLQLCAPVLLLASVLWLIAMLWFWHPLAWPEGALKLPRFQAHRGSWKLTGEQENTIAAFRAARTAGAEMVELDVQLAGDGQVVVFHDYDLKRLGGGSEKKVLEVSSAEMLKLAKAPLLKEVLADPQGPTFFNIEIKSGKIGDGKLERAVAQVIQETNSTQRVLISSFNPFVLHRLSKLLPNVPRALLVSEELDPGNRFFLRKMLLGFYARPHLMHLHHGMLTERRMQQWRDRGIPIAAWTVNDEATAKKYFGWGLKSVISDEIYG